MDSPIASTTSPKAWSFKPALDYAVNKSISTRTLDSTFEPRYQPWRGNQCPVCLDDYEEGQTVVVLPCHHYQHEACFTYGQSVDISLSCAECRGSAIDPWTKAAIDIELLNFFLERDHIVDAEFGTEEFWRQTGELALQEMDLLRAIAKAEDPEMRDEASEHLWRSNPAEMDDKVMEVLAYAGTVPALLLRLSAMVPCRQGRQYRKSHDSMLRWRKNLIQAASHAVDLLWFLTTCCSDQQDMMANHVKEQIKTIVEVSLINLPRAHGDPYPILIAPTECYNLIDEALNETERDHQCTSVYARTIKRQWMCLLTTRFLDSQWEEA